MKLIRYFVFTLAATILTGCGNDKFDLPDYYDTATSTKLGQQIVDACQGYIGHVKEDWEMTPAEGLSLLSMSYVNDRGYAMQMYLYKVELGSLKLRVTLPDDGQVLGNFQALSAQAAAIERKSVWTVLGAVSGSAADSRTPGQPAGILYRNGVAINANMGNTPAFFAILDDGDAVCLPADDYESVRAYIVEGLSGEAYLLQDGYFLAQSSTTNAARSAVGVSEDGREVFLMTVDGSDFYYSNGISYDDLALLMRSAGAVNAMALDSGANVTTVWRNERNANLFEVLNKPAGNGLEAGIINGLAIIKR